MKYRLNSVFGIYSHVAFSLVQSKKTFTFIDGLLYGSRTLTDDTQMKSLDASRSFTGTQIVSSAGRHKERERDRQTDKQTDTDWLEDALSDGAKYLREKNSIAQLVDKAVWLFYDDVPQSPVDPAGKHLLLDVCTPHDQQYDDNDVHHLLAIIVSR